MGATELGGRNTPADSNSMVVDPRKMVTLELYESAKRHLSTLDTQIRKLEAKLEEIRE